MKYTEVYGLRKPESTDFYNIDDFNENTEIIEQELNKLEEKSVVSAMMLTKNAGVQVMTGSQAFLLLSDATPQVSAGNLQRITTTMNNVLTEGDTQRVTGIKIGKGINRIRVDFSSAFRVSGNTDLYVRIMRLRGREFSPVYHSVNSVNDNLVTVTGSVFVEVQENDFIFLEGDMANSSADVSMNVLYTDAITSLCVQSIG